MRIVLWTLNVLLLILPVVAGAQDIRGGRLRGGGYWGGGGYDHASTFAEGAQRGFADIVRSAGARNLMDSEAAINWTVARRNDIANRLYGTETYFQMRAVNRRARAAERGPRPSMEDLIRLAKAGKPKQLSPSEFDPLSGAIQWPSALLGEEYKDDLSRLEAIYAKRAADGFLSGEQLVEVRGLVQNVEAELKQNLQKYPPQSYTQAKNFLKSLAYEAILPPK